MPKPTLTELARDAQQKYEVLRTEFDFFKSSIESLELRVLRERVAILETTIGGISNKLDYLKDDFRDANYVELKSQLAVLRQMVEDIRKREDETDRRRWQIVAAGVASILALIVNLILIFVKK